MSTPLHLVETPLITPASIEQPLSQEQRDTAVRLLAGSDLDATDLAVEALGRYHHTAVGPLEDAAALAQIDTTPSIEAFEERLVGEIQESDLLQRLIRDLSHSRQVLRHKASRITVMQEKFQVYGAVPLEDLPDEAELLLGSWNYMHAWSDQLVDPRLAAPSGTAESWIRGTVTGKDEIKGKTTVLLRVTREDRSEEGDAKFADLALREGDVVPILGTTITSRGLWHRGVTQTMEPHKTLKLADEKGRPFVHGKARLSGNKLKDPQIHGMPLSTLYVDGKIIFSERL